MDFSSYDSWKLGNDEPSFFKCPECGWKKEIEELCHTDEMCNDCYAKLLEEENA